jgi:hypothetical protein
MPIIKTVGVPRQYKSEEEPRQYKLSGSLKWEMTDRYGYPVKLSEIRGERIDTVLSNQSDGVTSQSIRYSISLKKLDEDGWGHYNCDVYEGKLSLYSTIGDGSNHIRIKLKCEDLVRAEELVQLLIEGNNLEVMPVHRAGFKR